MHTANKLRLPGIAGIIFALMLVVAFGLDFALIATTGGEPTFNLANIGPDLLRAQKSAIWPVETWIYALMIVPFSVFALGVYLVLRAESDKGFPALGVVTTLVFWIFSTLHNAAILTVLQVLIPSYAAGSPAAPSIEVMARGLLGFGNTLFTPGGGVGTLLLVIGMAVTGRATLAGGQLPRWTGYVAMACAGFSLLGYLQYLSRGLLVLGLIGFVLYILWVIGVAIRLLRA